jgi:hypothetical protein
MAMVMQCSNLIAQNTSNRHSYNNNYEVIIDYDSGRITYPVKPNGKPQKLKVGQSLVFRTINMPCTWKLKAEAVLSNDKMEGAASFAKIFSVPEPGSTTSTNVKATASKEQEETKEIKSEKEQMAKKNDSIFMKQISSDTSNFKFKTDIDSLQSSLAVSTAENFLKELNDSNKLKGSPLKAKLKRAIEDLQWQKSIAFKNAQDNINSRDNRHEERRRSLAKEIDSLKGKIAEFKTKEFCTKSLIGIQILNRDMVNVKLQLLDDQNNVKAEKPIAFSINNGFKLDFSTGIFNSLHQRSEYKILNKVDSTGKAIDSTFNIRESKMGNTNLAIGILAHGYWKWGKYSNVGLSFGAGYQLGTQQLAYLTGFSLLLGREQRIIVTGGISYSKVSQLSVYEINRDYDKSYVNAQTDLKLAEKMMPSGFVGITYNLGNINSTIANISR